jgi:hypothetical protein
MSIEQIQNMPRSGESGSLRDEIAGLSKGDPRIFDAYLDKTRLEMWKIALGGM